MVKKKIINVLCAVLLVSALSGCGAEEAVNDAQIIVEQLPGEGAAEESSSFIDDIYNDVFDRMEEEGGIPTLEGDNVFERTAGMFMNGWQSIYRVFRTLSPIIVICSIAIGVLTMVLARQNKQIKRTGLFIFVIGIPLAVIIAVFGIGIMNGVLRGW